MRWHVSEAERYLAAGLFVGGGILYLMTQLDEGRGLPSWATSRARMTAALRRAQSSSGLTSLPPGSQSSAAIRTTEFLQ